MYCRVCGRETNRIMIRRGTGLCCNICEQIENVDIDKNLALDYLWSIDTNRSVRTYEDIKDGVIRGA